MAWLFLILGLIGLAVGGDVLVRGAVGIADRLHVSRLLTGLIIVGFGTSMPELAASLNAALSGSPGIAVGNVVGSNIANVLLILGLTALICPLSSDAQTFKRDAPVLAFATLVFCIFAWHGTMGRALGSGLVTGLALYIFLTFRQERTLEDKQAQVHADQAGIMGSDLGGLCLNIALTGAGIAMVVLGALWTIDGAVVIARTFEVPETIIGLTVVAIGTSLPELATSTMAAMRREVDIAFGNILGSNIFNILGILGVTAVVSPIAVPRGVVNYDLWILGLVTILLLLFAFTSAIISRREGAFFLTLYVAYMGFLVLRSVGIIL